MRFLLLLLAFALAGCTASTGPLEDGHWMVEEDEEEFHIWFDAEATQMYSGANGTYFGPIEYTVVSRSADQVTIEVDEDAEGESTETSTITLERDGDDLSGEAEGESITLQRVDGDTKPDESWEEFSFEFA